MKVNFEFEDKDIKVNFENNYKLKDQTTEKGIKVLMLKGEKGDPGQDGAEWGKINGTLSKQIDLKNALDKKADKTDIPTKTSQLENDSGFLTQHQDLTNYYRKEEVNNLLNELDTIPKGGTTGQVLAKKTDTDNDVEWVDQSGSGSVTGDTLPIGSIMPYGSDTIPTNWLLCDGREVSRTEYQNLFNVIGTTYGAGDGTTTFNLPNLKGKVTVGKDNNDLNFDNLGETGGEKTHTLTIDEMPKHKHNSKARINWYNTAAYGLLVNQVNSSNASVDRETTYTDEVGGDNSHNNMPPYLITNYIIKSNQSAGLVANVSNTKSTSDTDVYSATYINNIISNKLNITDLISFVYPVGSIYMSVNNVSPATFMGGTWEQIKDRFLLSAGDTYSAGNTGGSATHSHSLSRNAGANFRKMGNKFIQGEKTLAGVMQKEDESNVYWITEGNSDYSADTPETAGVSLYGNTDATTNLPPYLAVYMWKRTA